MELYWGFTLVIAAGFFQGTFVLPMTMTKNWEWEHIWAVFSFFAMLLFNWGIAFITIPGIFDIFAAVPGRDIVILLLFGAGWGAGAILFGLGMDRLGMALGYPIIMGLIASLGAYVPLIVFYPEQVATPKGLVLSAGVFLVIAGLILCSAGGARKSPSEGTRAGTGGTFAAGLAIAIAAGVLSCLPNVGMAFTERIIEAARSSGVSGEYAVNIVFVLIFSVGFVANAGYCLYLMARRGTAAQFTSAGSGRNIVLGVIMGIMWIGSFYLYGMGAVELGRWGVIIGWPLFMSLSIIVGNLWGIRRGEWRGAPARARSLLNRGLAVLIVAVIVIALSNSL